MSRCTAAYALHVSAKTTRGGSLRDWFAQGPLAGVLALATLGTALFTYGVPLLDPAGITAETFQSALPGTALLAAVLAVHEGGHQWVR